MPTHVYAGTRVLSTRTVRVIASRGVEATSTCWRMSRSIASNSSVFTCLPVEQGEDAGDVEHHQPGGKLVERVETDPPGIGCREPRRERANLPLDGIDLAKHQEA